jgi:hypothetical protein
MRRLFPDGKRKVRSINIGGRVEDGLSHLSAMVANGQARGLMTSVVCKNGDIDTRSWGDVRNQELEWAGAVLTDAAMRGSE